MEDLNSCWISLTVISDDAKITEALSKCLLLTVQNFGENCGAKVNLSVVAKVLNSLREKFSQQEFIILKINDGIN